MSLECHECGRSMGPSETLPGREGAMVHPVVPSLIYVPSQKRIDYKLSYIFTPANRSLCFECIENKLPNENKQTVLRGIYDCYEAEMEHKKIDESIKGQLISVGDPLNVKEMEALKKCDELSKKVTPDCIFCSGNVRNGKPFFLAATIDRVYSSKNLTLGTNYSWSDMKTGYTSFRICFDDFRKHFPRCFEQLSYDMLEERNPNIDMGPSEFYISPEFEKALKEETGKTIDDFVNEFAKKGIKNLRVIRKSKK